jgi:hypothetical protein
MSPACKEGSGPGEEGLISRSEIKMKQSGGSELRATLPLAAAARPNSADISPVCEWKLRAKASKQWVFLGSCGLPDRPFLARQLGEFSLVTGYSLGRQASEQQLAW